MNQTTENNLSQEEIQDLADIVFHQLFEADRQLKKYCQIASDYILIPEYKYKGCTTEQADNCVKLWSGKVNHYNNLFVRLKSLGAE